MTEFFCYVLVGSVVIVWISSSIIISNLKTRLSIEIEKNMVLMRDNQKLIEENARIRNDLRLQK